jgi:hypothetical protein
MTKMTIDGGVYVYGCPDPLIKTTPCDSGSYIFIQQPPGSETKTAECLELQSQVEELTWQNSVFMEALRYCLSKIPLEEKRKDWRLGAIELASKEE